MIEVNERGTPFYVDFSLNVAQSFFCTWIDPLFTECSAGVKLIVPEDENEPTCYDGTHIHQVTH